MELRFLLLGISLLFFGGQSFSQAYAGRNQVTNSNKSWRSLTVVLDPGHGGKDSVTRGNGIVEKNLVLEVAKAVRAQLENEGYRVLMTREDDTYLPIPQRASVEGDVLISIHANAVPDSIGPSVRELIKGTEIFIRSSSSEGEFGTECRLLADEFQAEFRKFSGLSFRGVKRKKLAVLENAAKPAILVELGFLSNAEDAAFLSDKSNHQQIAIVFLQALDNYQKKLKNKKD